MYCTLLGLKKSQLIGKSVEDVVLLLNPKFDLKSINTFLKKIKYYDQLVVERGEVEEPLVYESCMMDKSVFYDQGHIRVYKSLISWMGHKRILTIVLDISDRVKKEHELKESEERFRKVFELSTEAFVWLDTKTNTIVNCNHKFTELVVSRKHEIIHKKLFMFFSEPMNARSKIMSVLRREVQRVELMLVNSVGRKLYVEIRGVMIEVNKKRTAHISILDISDTKKIEAEKEEMQLRLMTAAKLSLIGEMSAGLAHEINNPLMIMLGNLDLLEERMHTCSSSGTCEEDLAEYVSSIREAGGIINELVTRMKDHIKKFQPDDKDYHSINCILKQALDVLKFKNIRHKINIIDETDDTKIYCSKTEIFQVFTNLLSNSVDEIKYTKYRDIRIYNFNDEVSTHIVFEDCGHGVKEDDVQKIFNPFYTTKRGDNQVGTGLGLSFCVKWLHMNNAKIDYKREKGKTHFICIFPRVTKYSTH